MIIQLSLNFTINIPVRLVLATVVTPVVVVSKRKRFQIDPLFVFSDCNVLPLSLLFVTTMTVGTITAVQVSATNIPPMTILPKGVIEIQVKSGNHV